MSTRLIFCVSDHTGLTAEALAHSLMSRFEGTHATYEIRPFVDTVDKAEALVAELSALAADGPRPIVFSTITNGEIREVLERADALVLGLFEPYIDQLRGELAAEPSDEVGQFHRIRNSASYQWRIDAVDFALITDDGLSIEHYDQADIVLTGVSRVGKTPTCLYLSMHFGILAANYPLTDTDTDTTVLPEALRPHRDKLFGLTIDPLRLHYIREQRKPGTSYATLPQCDAEVVRAERLFQRHGIPVIDVTARSIEEITATIMKTTDLPRRVD